MDKRTAEALEASIKHWQENVVAETPGNASIDTDDCALCKVFFEGDCRGCPIQAATGDEYCWGTPYEEARELFNEWEGRPHGVRTRGLWRVAAQKELDFLISLRGPDRERRRERKT